MASAIVHSSMDFVRLANESAWQSSAPSTSPKSTHAYSVWYGISAVLLLAATWILTNFSLFLDAHQKGTRRPPVLPYWIPGIGHTMTFIFNRAKLLDAVQ